MNKLVIAAIAAATLVPVAAQAQDVAQTQDTAQAQSVEPGSFAGLRVEGNLGWDRQQAYGNHHDKLGYGGSAGWDGNLTNRIVVGPEVNYWHPDGGRNAVDSDDRRATNVGGDIWGAAVRVGFRATPNLMIFGKGGYASQSQRTYSATPAGVLRSSYHVDGYQVGGGVQYSPADKFSFVPANVYLSAQYVYSNFDNHTSDQHAMGGIGIRFR
jgi:outer membrane immunogenic protein